MMLKRLNVLVKTFVILALLFCSLSIAEPQKPTMSPLMPSTNQEIPPGTGYLPPQVDLSGLDKQNIPFDFVRLDLPARYDWREEGIITPIGDQGSCASCYAFAALSDFESRLLIKNDLDDDSAYIFSVNNLKECNWYETSCVSGNFMKMVNFLSKAGSVRENCDPYIDADTSCITYCPYIKTVLDWRRINGNNTMYPAEYLKNYIYANGPVFSCLYTGNSTDSAWYNEFRAYDGSYTLYYPYARNINHAIVIVGWDDSLQHDGGYGGWIAKNSWGNNWGGPCGYGQDSGYFYIAYNSASIGCYSSFIQDWQDYDTTGNVLFYDEGGWTSDWGYSGEATTWGLCKFSIPTSTYISRVEFWTSFTTNDIDIYVYDDFNGFELSNLLGRRLNISYDQAGYHSVEICPIEINASEDVYVAIKITNAVPPMVGMPYPIIADILGPNETAKTYISLDGSDSSWYDLGANEGADVAFRLRTSDSPLQVTYEYLPGDANMYSGNWPPQVIGGDVTYLTNYFRGQATSCLLDGFYASADVNGSCSVTGSDVTTLVNYFRNMAELIHCPDYLTPWPVPEDLPDSMPSSWPNCD